VAQTVMVVFKRYESSLHLPSQFVTITPTCVTTERGIVALSDRVAEGESLQWFLTRQAGSLREPDHAYYDSVEAHRLMPSGEELAKALEQFETDSSSCPMRIHKGEQN
jgi:hypothetical protein